MMTIKRSVFWLSLIVVAVLSLLPVDFLPPQTLNVWDKAQHALAFACLALLGLQPYPTRPWRLALWLLAYGGAIEILQSVTGWRYGDWLDWLADGLGIATGVLLWHLLRLGRPRTGG